MRKSLLLIIFLLIVLIVPIVIHGVQAITYQDFTGKLDGANYLIRIPSNWNGDLFVYCRGYSHLLSGVNMGVVGLFSAIINNGYAFAESDYGVGGYCIKEGMIRTHQLTEYVIDNFHVTGRVYLIGISMGGNTVLELGAKYPDLYSGVLDIAGTKDVITRYYLHSNYAGIADDAALSAAVLANGGKVPPYPTTSIAGFRNYCTNSVADVTDQCKGTPDEKIQFYERISPIYDAVDISVPTITIHGTADALVPYSQSVAYMNAIDATGHSDLYRLYKVVGGEHASLTVVSQITLRFNQLVDWAENGNPAPPSNP